MRGGGGFRIRPFRPIAAALLLVAALGAEAAHAAYPVAQNGRIVFERDVNGTSHIFVMNADGSNPVDLSPPTTQGDFDPQFSPNGRQIVFGRAVSPEGTFHTFVMNADGTGAVDLTPGLQGALSPTYSPDGKQIAFNMDINQDLELGLYTAAIMNADGSGVRDLTPGDSSFELRPDFSPDGAKIVFERDGPSTSALYMINPDGSGAARLTPPGNASDTTAAFSPTGGQLAWSRDPDVEDSIFRRDIFVGDTALGGATSITSASSYTFQHDPAFSPDGTRIAFAAVPGMAAPDLFLVGSGGGAVTPLHPASENGANPAWEYLYTCAKRRATIVGDDGPEVIKGTKRADVIVANGGKDTVKGKGGNDRICGGRGKDRLFGGKGKKDRLRGGPGKDKLKQ